MIFTGPMKWGISDSGECHRWRPMLWGIFASLLVLLTAEDAVGQTATSLHYAWTLHCCQYSQCHIWPRQQGGVDALESAQEQASLISWKGYQTFFFFAWSAIERTLLLFCWCQCCRTKLMNTYWNSSSAVFRAIGGPLFRACIWSSVYCYRDDFQALVPGKISHKVCCSVKPKPLWDYTATGGVTWLGHRPKRN